MAEPAVVARGLTKRYGARSAVDTIDLDIPIGAIAGLVGPNAAGKTTTMRMLLGLIRPTSGEARVFGSPITRPHEFLHLVGATIEHPAFHQGLTGWQNLDLLCRAGGVPPARVAEVAGEVGLAERAHDLYGTYSLGMKQRLAIAAALAKRPRLLVMDEPTNGLDPQGIRDVKALVRQLHEAGTTVVISSHLLGEIEDLCDQLVVLQAGRVTYQGAVGAFEAGDVRLVLRAADPGRSTDLVELMRSLGFDADAAPEGVLVRAPERAAGELNAAAFAAGLVLCEITVHRRRLEERFLDMVEATP